MESSTRVQENESNSELLVSTTKNTNQDTLTSSETSLPSPPTPRRMPSSNSTPTVSTNQQGLWRKIKNNVRPSSRGDGEGLDNGPRKERGRIGNIFASSSRGLSSKLSSRSLANGMLSLLFSTERWRDVLTHFSSYQRRQLNPSLHVITRHCSFIRLCIYTPYLFILFHVQVIEVETLQSFITNTNWHLGNGNRKYDYWSMKAVPITWSTLPSHPSAGASFIPANSQDQMFVDELQWVRDEYSDSYYGLTHVVQYACWFSQGREEGCQLNIFVFLFQVMFVKHI